jgi:hypothetical protein
MVLAVPFWALLDFGGRVLDGGYGWFYMAFHRGACWWDAGRFSVADTDGQRSSGLKIGERWLSACFVGRLFDIVGLMKGHVGGGVRSGELKAPATGYRKSLPVSCPSYPLRLTSAGIGSLKLGPGGRRFFRPFGVGGFVPL